MVCLNVGSPQVQQRSKEDNADSPNYQIILGEIMSELEKVLSKLLTLETCVIHEKQLNGFIKEEPNGRFNEEAFLSSFNHGKY
jgi:hypothetical protein